MNETTLLLRAHHICCMRFARWSLEKRGAEYAGRCESVRNALGSQNRMIQVVEGVDYICDLCPELKEHECGAEGGEISVRKWDSALLRYLGISFGTVMSAMEWRALIAARTPFSLCQRCLYRERCSQGKV